MDGVRAVAVLTVIAYHVTGNKPSGGFLGVDVFFVLSGYLITTLLLREYAASDSIHLGLFWARRARRLLPALLLLLAVCAGIVYRDGPTVSLGARRSDMLSTLFYYANWHFIARSESYFAIFTAGTSPLLHTWSLAIEEQFYLVWPLLVLAVLYVARGRRLALAGLIVVLTLASAIRMASLYDPVDPSRSYYGTDTRAQALLIGAALATLLCSRPMLMTGARARAAASWSGPLVALLVVIALLRFHERSSFYYHGGDALFAGLIATGLWAVETVPTRFPGAVLCLGPVRWIGRISYGLYLWHWPMITWLTPRWTHGHRELQVLEVAATFAAAAASYYLLELPIRSGAAPWVGRSSRRFALVASIAVAVVAGIAVAATTPRTALAREVSDTSESPCPPGSPSAGTYYVGTGLTPASWCVRANPSSRESSVVATVGDSTSRALDPGMRAVAAAHGWRYIQAGLDGCSVLRLAVPPNAAPVAARQARSCARVVPRLLRAVSAAYHPSVWIVSDLTGNDPLDPSGATKLRIRTIEQSIRSALRQLTADGAHVVVIAPLPDGEPIECKTEKPAPSYCTSLEFTTRDPLTNFIARLERREIINFAGKVTMISLDDILCPHGRCPTVIDGVLARFDSVHYTATFSRIIVPILIARAEQAGVHFTGDTRS